MGRQFDCFDICPSFYNSLSDPSSLALEMGYESLDEFLETYEMTSADLAAMKDKLKYYDDVVQPGYGSRDMYVIPIDLMTDAENMLLLDAETILLPSGE